LAAISLFSVFRASPPVAEMAPPAAASGYFRDVNLFAGMQLVPVPALGDRHVRLAAVLPGSGHKMQIL
jgi:hypothetical protein